MRVTLKTINNELAKRGVLARLAKASGYFYFHLGEAAGWLDRTIQVASVSALTLDQWLQEYARLKKINRQILSGVKVPRQPSPKKRPSKTQSRRIAG